MSYFKSIGNKKILQRNKEMEQQRLKELQEKEAELKAREGMHAHFLTFILATILLHHVCINVVYVL